MPNPNIPVPGTGIEAQWGANVVDRLVLVFDDVAARDGFHTTPEAGQVCYVLSRNSLQRYDGSQWQDVPGDRFLRNDGDRMEGTLVVNGQLEVLGLRSSTTTSQSDAFQPLFYEAGANGRIWAHANDANWRVMTGTADRDHLHDGRYSLDSHLHDGRYARVVHEHNQLHHAGGVVAQTSLGALTVFGVLKAEKLGLSAPYSTTNNNLPGWRHNTSADAEGWRFMRLSSSARYKDDIRDHDATVDLDRITSLRLRSWKSKAEADDKRRRFTGVVAEEAVEVMPELVGHDTDGQPESFSYEGLIVPLVGAVQALAARVEALEAKVEACCGS